MMTGLSNVILTPIRLFVGALHYNRTQNTPPSSYRAMILLFCSSKGFGLDFLNFLVKVHFKLFGRNAIPTSLYKISDPIGDTRGVDFVVREVKSNGYCILDTKVSNDILNSILKFGFEHGAQMRNASRVTRYCRETPEASRYDFRVEDILASKIFYPMLVSSFARETALKYMGCSPWLDVTSLWWHTSFMNAPDPEAAQLYHFDMDRLKWIKIFVYITDVTSTSGPHCFIRGSHKSGAIPYKFLKKGYARLTDKEVYQYYGKTREQEFIAPRGTVIIEDTRGLHKGKHPTNGDRLIFQFQLSNSKFGALYQNVSRVAANAPFRRLLVESKFRCTFFE